MQRENFIAKSKPTSRITEACSDVVDIALNLVAIPSTSPPGDTSGIVDYLEGQLSALPGASVKRYVTSDTVHNLVAHIESGQPGRHLVLNGHLDTFPLSNPAAWTKNPWGELCGDKIYGLGVSDMKGGVAASVMAFITIAQAHGQWKGSLTLTLAGDEEVMGHLGTKFLLENVPQARGDAVICADVGSPSVLRLGEKGLLWLKIRASGTTAHAAHVHKGSCAISRMLTVLSEIRALEHVDLGRDQVIDHIIDNASEVSERYSGQGESRVLKSLTVTVGTISGGKLMNLIADSAEATVDIRIPLGVKSESILARIKDVLDQVSDVEIDVIQSYDPTWTDQSDDVVKCMANAVTSEFGMPPVINMRVGASDARLHRHAGIPTVVCGLTPNNMGNSDEYIEVAELFSLTQAITRASLAYLA